MDGFLTRVKGKGVHHEVPLRQNSIFMELSRLLFYNSKILRKIAQGGDYENEIFPPA